MKRVSIYQGPARTFVKPDNREFHQKGLASLQWDGRSLVYTTSALLAGLFLMVSPLSICKYQKNWKVKE